jgi:hypothetical protein
MPPVLNLTVRKPIEVMRIVAAFFAGRPDAEITFEGDTSAIDWATIAGATVRQDLRLAVVPLTMASTEALMESVFPRLGLRSRVWHIIVRQRGQRLFASYDNFGDEQVVVAGCWTQGTDDGQLAPRSTRRAARSRNREIKPVARGSPLSRDVRHLRGPMTFQDVIFAGPPIDDVELLADLPSDLVTVLRNSNGLVAFRGGLHLRGACFEPVWHSLRRAWLGPESFAARYPHVEASDIPFAQDAVGDQFLLRGGKVVRLLAETGEIETLGATLAEFLDRACSNPVDCLGLQPLLRFEAEGGHLEAGQLLSVYPPFCTKESAEGVSLRAVPVQDRLGFLSALAAQIRTVGNGEKVKIVVVP